MPRAPTRCTAPAASGGSSSSACPGRSSTPSARRPPRSASRKSRTSTAATTRAAAISRSTSAAACAGAPPRLSCARRCGRPNLTVLTGAQATGIVFEGRRAVGRALRARTAREKLARARPRGACWRAARSARRSSCSSPASARRRCLQELGIPVVHAQDGVGANLQDHLQIRTVYKVKHTRTLNEQANSLLGRARMGLEYALFRRGPLTMAPSQLGAFAKSDPARETPDLEYHVQPLSLDKFGEPLHPFPAFTASVCNLRPRKPRHGADQEQGARATRRRSRRTTSRPRPIAWSRRRRSGSRGGSARRRRSRVSSRRSFCRGRRS